MLGYGMTSLNVGHSLEQLPGGGGGGSSSTGSQGGGKRRERLPTEPGPQANSGGHWDSVGTSVGHSSPLISSPIKSPPSVHSDSDDLDPNGHKSK